MVGFRLPKECCHLGIPPSSAQIRLCCAIASSDFMLSNLLDNSYSAANVNKFQLDRPKTCRFCTKTDSLDRGAQIQNSVTDSIALDSGGYPTLREPLRGTGTPAGR